MNKARNVLSALFVALAVFAWGACPLAAHAEESGVIKVSTADELKSALSSAGEGERVIRLADDIEAPGLGVSSTVTILGGGHTLTMSQYASIQVYSGAQLNLGAADGSDGAGVAVSAGYYAAYWGLCADTPSTGATEKQGLHIGKVSITDNKAGDEDCSGGGVLVFNVAAPATVSIDGATISGNSAAEGGGLAAYANGGLDTLTVTNTALCNNTAFSHGADVCTSRTKVSLSSARDMGENYLGKPDDVTGSRIDGWYVDTEDSRYAEQPASERQTFDGYASIGSDESVALVAASNNKLVKVSFTDESGDVTYGEGWYEPGTKADQIQVPTPTKDSDDTFDYVFDSWDSDITDVTSDAVYKAHFNKLRKRFGVKYAFGSATPGQQLPDEVLALLPKDENSYPRGSEIAAGTPSKTVVETADGIWTFEGYDRDFVTAGMDDADDEGNVSFSGTWKFTKKSTPVQPGGDTPANPGASSPAAPNAPASAGASSATALPQTSDPLGAGACLALLAAGVVALGAGVLAKK